MFVRLIEEDDGHTTNQVLKQVMQNLKRRQKITEYLKDLVSVRWQFFWKKRATSICVARAYGRAHLFEFFRPPGRNGKFVASIHVRTFDKGSPHRLATLSDIKQRLGLQFPELRAWGLRDDHEQNELGGAISIAPESKRKIQRQLERDLLKIPYLRAFAYQTVRLMWQHVGNYILVGEAEHGDALYEIFFRKRPHKSNGPPSIVSTLYVQVHPYRRRSARSAIYLGTLFNIELIYYKTRINEEIYDWADKHFDRDLDRGVLAPLRGDQDGMALV